MTEPDNRSWTVIFPFRANAKCVVGPELGAFLHLCTDILSRWICPCRATNAGLSKAIHALVPGSIRLSDGRIYPNSRNSFQSSSDDMYTYICPRQWSLYYLSHLWRPSCPVSTKRAWRLLQFCSPTVLSFEQPSCQLPGPNF